MVQPLEAEGQRTPVTMDNDRQPDQITEAEREELVRLLAQRAVRDYLRAVSATFADLQEWQRAHPR